MCSYIFEKILKLYIYFDLRHFQLRNGSAASSPIINQLCGNTLPNPIFATGDTLWMNLVTDSSIVHRGYDITWTASTSGRFTLTGGIQFANTAS